MEDPQNDSHSDSDSIENWIILDSNPSYNIETTSSQEQNQPEAATPAILYHGLAVDNGEETDGISIISDCESESTNEHVEIEEPQSENSTETVQSKFEHISLTPDDFTLIEPYESPFEDVLSDKTKLKTYVHKRNNKFSSMLNFILMGSILTAAGIALGHKWGIKEDCSLQQSNPSVNKLLSNLYKLQEENALLRSKLKELTQVNSSQVKQKLNSGKPKKCKKMFEEPLEKVNAGKITKCVDPDIEVESSLSHLVKEKLAQESQNDIFESVIGKTEFRDDLEILQNIDNKWLNQEYSKKFKDEYSTKLKKNYEDERKLEKSVPTENIDTEIKIATESTMEDKPTNPIHMVTYADSLKRSHFNKINNQNCNKRNNECRIKSDKLNIRNNKPKNAKIKSKISIKDIHIDSEDEDPIFRDKYQNSKKYKNEEEAKNDRRQTNKKQKRKNKYEQWELKGGYMKDYESIASLTVDEKNPDSLNDKRFNYEFDMYSNYFKEFPENNKERSKNMNKIDEEKQNLETDDKSKRDKSENVKNNEVNNSFGLINDDWFAKRSALRREARDKLLKKNYTMKMNARWYFRRMKDRESQRANLANNTRNRNQRRNYKQRR